MDVRGLGVAGSYISVLNTSYEMHMRCAESIWIRWQHVVEDDGGEFNTYQGVRREMGLELFQRCHIDFKLCQRLVGQEL